VKASSIIRLRPAKQTDAEMILDWENNLENWAISDNDSAYTLFDIQALIYSLQDIKESCQGRYMIVDLLTEDILGSVDLFEINWEERSAEVGVLIADIRNRSRGYASLGLNLLEKMVVEKWQFQKLSAEVHTTNIPSIRLFEKCGYQKKGTNEVKSPNGDYIESILFEKWLNVS
jgi:diamine N-acetyltransferase